MENKYYDLIISLIKEHKKYSGLEPILENIAEDVSLKSQNIIESIDDEEVIKNYLNKVISCSILTVSKKMGYNKRISSPINLDIQNNNSVVNILEETPVIEEISQDIEPQISEELEVLETFDTSIEEPQEKSFDTETIEYIENDVEKLQESDENVDISLVDKMINGVSNDEIEEQFIESEQLENYEIIETSIEENPIEEILINSLEVLENTEEKEEEIIIEEINLETIIEEPDNIVEIEALELTIEDTIDSLDFEDTNLDSIEVVSEDLEIIEEDSMEETREKSTLNFPNFDNLDLTIEPIEYDTKMVIETLRDLDSSAPDKQILKICNLKFKQKLSIEEIANQLNTSQETVLNALREITNSIKD